LDRPPAPHLESHRDLANEPVREGVLMRHVLIPAAALVVLGGLLAGCSKSPVNAPKSNVTVNTAAAQARVASIMAGAPQVIEDRQFESSEVATLGLGRTGALAAISPLRFWRTITHVERSYDFAFSDPDSLGKPRRAIVTVTKVLTGGFNIATAVTTSDSIPADSVVIIHKPLDDHWVRKLVFIRVPHPAECDSTEHHGRSVGSSAVADADTSHDDEDWRLVGTSGVQVTSNDAQTRIVSLRVQATGLDTTLTDPLGLFRLRRVLRFEPGTALTLTVTTLRSDDLVVLLLHGHRVRFTNNGDGTYTGSLQLPSEEDVDDLRHIGVNAFSHGTLFDDQLPYDSQAWILPFMVKPNQMAEELH
jgi:hypothetical protein